MHDWVTIRPYGCTFKGKRFGYSAGCWIVSKKIAKQICEVFGYKLPRCGYDRMLDDTGHNYVTNISNAEYRVSLRGESYDNSPIRS